MDSKRFLELQDYSMRVVVDGDTGGLFLVEYRVNDQAVVCPGRSRPLVSVDFKRSGEREWTRIGPEDVTRIISEPKDDGWTLKEQPPEPAGVRPRSVEFDGERLTANFVFGQEGLGRAEVTYTIEPGVNAQWRWEVTARCLEGPADVVAVSFPILEHVRIGDSGLDDIQFRMQSFGHQAVQPGMHPLRDESYCGGVVAAWQEVYDGQNGLYVGAHDPTATNVLFVSKSSGITGEHFTCATRKLDDIKPGEERTYPYQVSAHWGDWHSGARWYGDWFNRTFGVAQYPDWLGTCDGWLDLQAENYGKDFRFDQLPDWMTAGQAIGIDWTQVWGQFAYDGGPCCTAWYMPSPLYGGAEGWQAAAAEIKRRGGHIGGYFIYDRLDLLPVATDYFLGHFRKADYPPDAPWVTPEQALSLLGVTDTGNVAPTWPPPADEIERYRQEIEAHQALYQAGERAPAVQWWRSAWINDPQWWEFLRFWIADKYVREWGCNTCYVDVLGTGGAALGYDPRRGQNGTGQWGMGRLGIARTMVEDARRADPDFVASMEGMGDLPGRYCASMCSGVYRGARNVMRYTFPERVFIHGGANPRSGGSYFERYLETFLEGMRYDIVGRPGADSVGLLQLQRNFTPWLYQARFSDTIGMEVSDPRVEARWFYRETAAGPGAIITIANPRRLAGVTIAFDDKMLEGRGGAFCVTHQGQAGTLELTGQPGRATFTVPDDVASMVYLTGEKGSEPALWPLLRRDRG
ncbi:MAG TPA: hypothetical protein VM283_06630, partial [Armatimonadota bacterium]|nr:hypothetical protein [Armatimonadota bacterium]